MIVPEVGTKRYGEIAFVIYAPKLWNRFSGPEGLRGSKSVDTFKP